MAKYVYVELEFVALHQSRPSGYSVSNGPYLSIGAFETRLAKYSLTYGTQDPGKLGDTFDYAEFKIAKIHTVKPSYYGDMISYPSEGGSGVSTRERVVTQKVPDNFLIPDDLRGEAGGVVQIGDLAGEVVMDVVFEQMMSLLNRYSAALGDQVEEAYETYVMISAFHEDNMDYVTALIDGSISQADYEAAIHERWLIFSKELVEKLDMLPAEMHAVEDLRGLVNDTDDVLGDLLGGGGTPDPLVPPDVVKGSEARDVLSTSKGGTALYGGGGNDKIHASVATGAAAVIAYGGAGNDHFVLGGGKVQARGGIGRDLYELRLEERPGAASHHTIIDTDGRLKFSFTRGATDYGQISDLKSLLSFEGFSRKGGDLTLEVSTGSGAAATTHSITLRDYYSNPKAWTISAELALEGASTSKALKTFGFAAALSLFDPARTGGAGRDALQAASWGEILYGRGGDDSLNGGKGYDKLYGGEGNDHFAPSTGNDQIYGGLGHDTVSFAGLKGPESLDGFRLSVDLTARTAKLSDGSRYLLDSIEEVVGTGGADHFRGRAGRDAFYGGAGDDRIVATSGADYYHGGIGDDLVAYDAATSGVTLSLMAGQGSYGLAAGHRYVSIESIRGGSFADRISGNMGDNALLGMGGSDYLYGGSGDDLLWGFAGDDRLYGGNGSDRIWGGAGDDLIFGGAGTDYVHYLGPRNDFKITALGDGRTLVEQLSGASDGRDILQDVEWLEFWDRSVLL